MLGRPAAQGWLRLVLRDGNSGFRELVFSPLENQSSFVSSPQETVRGKKQNYQNNLELCRQTIIDAMPDTPAMRESLARSMAHVQHKLAAMKQFTTDNAAADLFKKLSAETAGMAEIDERIEGYKKQQHEVLLRIQRKIRAVEDGNLVRELPCSHVLLLRPSCCPLCVLLAHTHSTHTTFLF